MAETTDKPIVMPFKDPLPPIEEMWRERKQEKIRHFPQSNLRASSIGWPCDRYHYHAVKDWKEVPLHDVGLQAIFDEGDLHEEAVIDEVKKLPGIKIVKQQVAFQMDKPLIKGTIDGMMRWNGRDFPFDVKSMSRFQFPKIKSAEDLINSTSALFRKYVAQLQIYLLLSGYEIGAFILKCKDTGEIRVIWMQIDYAFLEGVIQRAERVTKALAAEQPPERTKDIELCLKCPYRHVCLPEIAFGEGVQILGGQELTEMLERRDQLQAASKEFDEIDKSIKALAKATGEGEKVAGDFLINVKKKSKKAFSFAASEYLEVKIVKLTPQAGGADDDSA